LAKAGKKVLLLEASDHIGGRTHHKNVPLLGDSTLNFEYGANFIHGASSLHPVYQLALKMGNV
jgi:phytoene dehydrogenase-like protein